MFHADHLASSATRLLSDGVLRHALANMRHDALEYLVSADASDMATVMRSQAEVRACDEFLATLRRFIDALPDPDSPEGE